LVSPPDGHAPAPRELPATANLEHLKKQAKLRLRALRARAPDARLADAQLAVAREYGFASWRALKVGIEQIGSIATHGRLTGYYRLDPEVVSNSVIMVTEERGQLFAQNDGRPRTPLTVIGDDIFAIAGTSVRYRFEGPPGEPAERVVIGTGGRVVVAVRTDVDDAAKAQADYVRDLAEQARPRNRIAVDPDTLEAYVGIYASPRGTTIEVTRRASRLSARIVGQPDFEIQCEAKDRFFYVVLPAQISFSMRNGSAEALMLHQHGRTSTFPRTSREAAAELVEEVERRRAEQERPRMPVTLSVETLGLYVGRYDMGVRTSLTVTLEGDRLFGEMTGQRRFEMFAEAEAQFFLTIAAVQISFIEDSSGRIDRAVIHQYGGDHVLMREIPEGEGA
jgi:hypothetical protein